MEKTINDITKNVSKQQVINSLGKDKLTMWDLEILLGYVFKHLHNLKESKQNDFTIFNPLSSALQEDLDYTVQKTTQICERLSTMETRIYEEREKSYERVKKNFDAQAAKFSQLCEKADNMAVKMPELKIPHGYEKAIELAERMSRMSSEEIETLIAISKASNQSTPEK